MCVPPSNEASAPWDGRLAWNEFVTGCTSDNSPWLQARGFSGDTSYPLAYRDGVVEGRIFCFASETFDNRRLPVLK